MKWIRQIDFDFYANWYLDREVREKNRWRTPSSATGRVRRMKWFHGGKMVDWFESDASWSIVQLTRREELESLLVLSSPWTRGAGLIVPSEARILKNAARRARQIFFQAQSEQQRRSFRRLAWLVQNLRIERFFPRYAALGLPRLLRYYEQHLAGFRFTEENAVVLRSLEEAEEREIQATNTPQTCYYLHDGFGRLLSYMALLQMQAVRFKPVTAIVAQRNSHIVRAAA